MIFRYAFTFYLVSLLSFKYRSFSAFSESIVFSLYSFSIVIKFIFCLYFYN